MALPYYTIIEETQLGNVPGIGLQINLPKSEAQLNEFFSRPGLTKLVLDVSKGFGVIPPSIKAVKNLKFLCIENLEKTEGIIELPSIFLELESLECLQIVKCKNLDFGQKSWKNLSNLAEFYVYNSGVDFPMGMLDLPRLEILRFSSCLYSNIPKKINQLKSIKKLSLNIHSQEKILPEEITQLPLLEALSIDTFYIPEWIGRCNPLLRELRLYPSKGTEIPEIIFEYKHLESLVLYNAGMEKLSPKIGQLSKLKYLQLRYNQLKSLPDSFSNLVYLETLDIAHNQLVKMQGLIGKLPKLKNLDVEFQSAHPSDLGQFERFLKWLNKDFKTQEERDFFTDLWDLKESPLDIALLGEALTSGVKPLNQYALVYLTQKSALAYRKFQAGDILFLATNTDIPKTTLKEKLATKNITISTKYHEKVTHILVSESLKSAAFLHTNLPKETCVLSEQQLLNFLNEIQPDYIVEAEQSKALDMPQHINSLLLSMDPSNIELAFTLMKSGGVPSIIATALFCVYKISKDKKQAATALKYLQQIASEPLSVALKKRIDFHTKTNQRAFSAHAKVFENTELDMIQFALKHYESTANDRVVDYVLRKNQSRANLECLKMYLISNNYRLDLPLYYYELDYIPKEIADLHGVKEFRIQHAYGVKDSLKTLLPILEKLHDLQVLELEYDIEELEMGQNQLIQSLKGLKNLQKLKIYNMTDALKNNLQSGLPNCLITTR